MFTLAINLSLVEIIGLSTGASTLCIAIYFFIRSRNSLRETLKANESFYTGTVKNDTIVFKREKPVVHEESFTRKKVEKPARVREENFVSYKREIPSEENMVHEMRATIAQQQRLLDSYLHKAEELEKENKKALEQQNNELEREIAKLHQVIESKDAEIDELQQQAKTAQKMSQRIEEVYREFDLLQSKMTSLEEQARRANNLAIELEDTKHAYEQVHKELTRKQERLEEIIQDNQRLHQEMNTLEDKLSEANLQRQQLQKKVTFLQDLNTDMQNISETNKKLQNELRRISELESMLSIMTEEREMLLRSRQQSNRSSL